VGPTLILALKVLNTILPRSYLQVAYDTTTTFGQNYGFEIFITKVMEMIKLLLLFFFFFCDNILIEIVLNQHVINYILFFGFRFFSLSSLNNN
jgi:hypothetical protein